MIPYMAMIYNLNYQIKLLKFSYGVKKNDMPYMRRNHSKKNIPKQSDIKTAANVTNETWRDVFKSFAGSQEFFLHLIYDTVTNNYPHKTVITIQVLC